MKKSAIYPCLFLLAAVFLLTDCGRHPLQETKDKVRPNVLFILTDDQGIGDLSLNGNDSLDTPHTDDLLQKSLQFNRFYVHPVCAPTRAAFLSGQYPQRNGALYVTRRGETMDDDVITIAELLQDNGYQTGLFGKWHNGATYPYNAAGQGFQEFLGFSTGHYNSYYDYYLENELGQRVPFQGYLTDVLTDTASVFMRKSKLPFFCMLTYQAPHTPIQAPEILFRKYKERGLTDYNAGIYAMIEANDLAIGRLLNDLEQAGKLDNTIIVFATDNGPNGDRYRMRLRGTKGHVDEGGVRVPFGIYFGDSLPYAGQQHEIDHPAANIDLLPTLLELLSIEQPENLQFLDGRSLVPLFSDGDWPDRNIFIIKQGLTYRPYPGGFRNDRFLYILRAPGEHELYDLKVDPSQTTNLFSADQPQHQQMAEEYAIFASEVAREDLVAPPIEIGHEQALIVPLLAHEGTPLGNATFQDQYGWSNDWVRAIKDPGDGIEWPVRVVTPGDYSFELEYATLHEKGAVELILSAGEEQVAFTVEPFPNEDLPTRDLVKRKEVYPRQWAKATAYIYLNQNANYVSIQPASVQGREILVKSVSSSKRLFSN